MTAKMSDLFAVSSIPVFDEPISHHLMQSRTNMLAYEYNAPHRKEERLNLLRGVGPRPIYWDLHTFFKVKQKLSESDIHALVEANESALLERRLSRYLKHGTFVLSRPSAIVSRFADTHMPPFLLGSALTTRLLQKLPIKSNETNETSHKTHAAGPRLHSLACILPNE